MNNRTFVASQLLASLMQAHVTVPDPELVPRAVAAADALLAALAASEKSEQGKEEVVPGDDK